MVQENTLTCYRGRDALGCHAPLQICGDGAGLVVYT